MRALNLLLPLVALCEAWVVPPQLTPVIGCWRMMNTDNPDVHQGYMEVLPDLSTRHECTIKFVAKKHFAFSSSYSEGLDGRLFIKRKKTKLVWTNRKRIELVIFGLGAYLDTIDRTPKGTCRRIGWTLLNPSSLILEYDGHTYSFCPTAFPEPRPLPIEFFIFSTFLGHLIIKQL